jgi:hypothetical protein
VELEWHTGGMDLEIEIVDEQRMQVVFEDAKTGEEWERGLAMGPYGLHRLARAIDMLPKNGSETA